MPEKETNIEQMILETAERLFLEKGFAMTSTTQIAKEVGCNQAMVHYYFRSKEKLFEAIFEKKIKMLVAPFLQPSDNTIPFTQRLTRLIETHFDIIKANPGIPFLFFNELLTNPVRLEAFKNRIADLPQSVLGKLGNDLRTEIEKGTIRPMSTIDLLMTIVSLNITIFLMLPLLRNAFVIGDKEVTELIEKRKQENVRIILKSLTP
jgi:AcrR family transcriptional regulator